MSAHAAERTQQPRREWWVRAASWALLAVLVCFIAFCALWRVQGGRWERVETPSMGRVAPVGSLLWVKPVAFDSLEPGDFITFRPPGTTDGTYSHRVYKRYTDGTISTKGVIPAPDPWRLHADDVVGEVRMMWWGAGWLVVAGPMLIIGGLIVAAVRAMLRRSWRLPATILLGSLAVTIAITWYRPFINAQQLAFAQSAHGGGADATYVGTGLLPIRLQAENGPHVDLSDGEVGSVHVTSADAGGSLRIDLKPAIPMWWWIALVGICFVPALYSLIIGLPPRPEADDADAVATTSRRLI
jgi:hypothetical protein